jgi:hypothetical protein
MNFVRKKQKDYKTISRENLILNDEALDHM